MVMKPEPVTAAIEEARQQAPEGTPVFLMSPQGPTLTQNRVQALARHLGGIPSFVLERPPTAELSPGQVDPLDYAVEAPRLEALVQGHRSDAALRRSEHKRRQFGVVLKVSETAFGSGRLLRITRR